LSPVDSDFEGDDLQFINEIKGGNIPKEFIPSVEKGFSMAMANGVLAGFPLNSLKVRLYDGSYHDVDSDALSFEICSQIAFKSAAKQADPKILEPIMKLTVITPEENMGDVIGDLNRRRGQVEGMEDKAGAKVVNAKVPLSEMFGYITDLRTITSGRATSTMEFFNFVEAPKNISDEVIKKVKGE
jgi:elongation factor G